MSSIKNLKEIFEKHEASTAETLDTLSSRINNLETVPAHDHIDTAAIIKKIEDTGHNITKANTDAINQLKDDILEVRNVIIKRLAEENRNLRGRVSLLEEKIGPT